MAESREQPIEYAWYLPSNKRGDTNGVLSGEVDIPASPDHLVHVAKIAEANGLENMLIPTNSSCLDGWTLASALSRETERLKFLVAVRPGLSSPALAVQQANTLDQISGGRLTINVVSGGSTVDQKRYGDTLDHDERYERADEFLDIARAFWQNPDGRVNHKGRFYEIEDGTVFPPPAQEGGPPIYFGGSSPAAKRVIARHADVFLKWGEPPDQIKEEFEEVRGMARAEGRVIRIGVRLHLLIRESDAQAKKEAEALVSVASAYGDVSEITGKVNGELESTSQQRMNAMTVGGKLWWGKALFSGINLVRQGAGTMLAGSPEVIAEAIGEYIDAGATSFILSGWPHDKEAENFGKLLRPLLPDTAPVGA